MAGEANGAMPQEVKGAFDNLQALLATNREKTEALEKQVRKGGEDAVTKAEWKKTSEAYDEFKKKINDELNALHRKANRPVVAQLDAKSAEIETKANREVSGWLAEKGMAAYGDMAKAAAFRAEYKTVTDKMVRRGEKSLSPDEQKTLAVGSAPDGGFYFEPTRSDQIVTKLRETSDMRSIASVMTISGQSLKFPVDRDDVTYNWVGEQTARAATTTAQVGELEIPTHELEAMPKATQNLLDDIQFDIEGWLNEKIADRFARGENTAFISGNGTAKPKGILSYAVATTADTPGSRAFGTLQYIGTGVSGDFAASNKADKLLDLIYAFNAGYRKNLTWLMTRTTLGLIRKFKDGDGNYICGPRIAENLQGATSVIDMIWNYPAKEFADMTELAANSYSIAVGDFKRGYQIVDKQGIRQLRDPFTDKPRVLFYTTKRVGGGIVDSDAIKLLKFA